VASEEVVLRTVHTPNIVASTPFLYRTVRRLVASSDDYLVDYSRVLTPAYGPA
jgi:hypothetical protein